MTYCKSTKKYAFFDLSWDSSENQNLYYPEYYDTDRDVWYSTNQRFFYPYWGQANAILDELMAIKKQMWRVGKFHEELYQKLLFRLKSLYRKWIKFHMSQNVINTGR